MGYARHHGRRGSQADAFVAHGLSITGSVPRAAPRRAAQALGALIAVALLLVGAIREWNTFLDDRPMRWAYVAGLAGGGLALLALYRFQRSDSAATR